MGILQELNDKRVWLAYLAHRGQSGYTGGEELAELSAYIEGERWRAVTEPLARGEFVFSLPVKSMIPKIDTDRKRILYRFPKDEAMVLKVLNFLLSRYDGLFGESCYAFRTSHTVKDASKKMAAIPNRGDKYTLKVDIQSYFNSIPTQSMIEMLEKCITDDKQLVEFFSRLLSRNQALWSGRVLEEPAGVLPGSATAGFLANLYLTDVDEFFTSRGVAYFRYSDDILLFVDSEEEQQRYLKQLSDMIRGKGLSLNLKKCVLTAPGQRWEYLGFSYADGECDLAAITVTKAKQRIRRHARELYREKRGREGMGYEETVKLLLKYFNTRFFHDEVTGFSWCRWYFSVITTSKSLEQIDVCMQQYIRYLYSGRHYKGNYRITYEKIKEMGYRSLVHEYYRYLKNE